MSVEIKQTCDSCGETRQIEVTKTVLMGVPGSTLNAKCDRDGWRQVRDNKHLCSTCINNAVK